MLIPDVPTAKMSTGTPPSSAKRASSPKNLPACCAAFAYLARSDPSILLTGTDPGPCSTLCASISPAEQLRENQPCKQDLVSGRHSDTPCFKPRLHVATLLFLENVPLRNELERRATRPLFYINHRITQPLKRVGNPAPA